MTTRNDSGLLSSRRRVTTSDLPPRNDSSAPFPRLGDAPPRGVAQQQRPTPPPPAPQMTATLPEPRYAGRCTRNPCRFMHTTPHTTYHYANTPSKYTRKPHSSREHNSKAKLSKNDRSDTRVSKPPHKSSSETISVVKPPHKSSSETTIVAEPCDKSSSSEATIVAKPCDKSSSETTVVAKPCDKSSSPTPTICKYWINGDCVYGQQCPNLHSWFHGDHHLSLVAKLQEHKKGITGIALPVGSDKLFSGSTDGTVRAWDCHTGGCTNLVKFGVEVTSLISEGPWIFVGLHKAVRAWNTQTSSELTLDGPKGQVLAMIVGNDTLFAGSEDGVISAWRGRSDANSSSPFELVAPLTGHSKAVVWDMDTLECKMTLNGHTDVVTSLICWDNYLLSSSIDCTIKVWAAVEGDTLNAIYTRKEESGLVALSGMTDAEANHILLCSCKDNSVRLYELPSCLND
ncbi:hypothetical protein Fmac_008699 [Flemingia macrophylla]|uniref:C3H1-type domain-containing protein n=1 Tax=Flemingia macrophylla TaxID=520843 RepID=A0ABD1MY38_9FABA